MKEPMSLRALHNFREVRKKIVKWIIRKSVRKLDEWEYGSILAYSWSFDDETEYHVLKEVSANEYHQYGTKVEYFND